MCRRAFVARVPCASTGLGSKIVFSIDEESRSAKCFRHEVSSADVGSILNMSRICKFMSSFEIYVVRCLTSLLPVWMLRGTIHVLLHSLG